MSFDSGYFIEYLAILSKVAKLKKKLITVYGRIQKRQNLLVMRAWLCQIIKFRQNYLKSVKFYLITLTVGDT